MTQRSPSGRTGARSTEGESRCSGGRRHWCLSARYCDRVRGEREHDRARGGEGAAPRVRSREGDSHTRRLVSAVELESRSVGWLVGLASAGLDEALREFLLPIHDRDPVGVERRPVSTAIAKCLPLTDKRVEHEANPINGVCLRGERRRGHYDRQRAARAAAPKDRAETRTEARPTRSFMSLSACGRFSRTSARREARLVTPFGPGKAAVTAQGHPRARGVQELDRASRLS